MGQWINRLIISRHPGISEELNYKAQIARGEPSALVKTVEMEILKASSEPGWRNYWKHTGQLRRSGCTSRPQFFLMVFYSNCNLAGVAIY